MEKLCSLSLWKIRCCNRAPWVHIPQASLLKSSARELAPIAVGPGVGGRATGCRRFGFGVGPKECVVEDRGRLTFG